MLAPNQRAVPSKPKRPHAVRTSAITGEGIDHLREAVFEYVVRHHEPVEVRLDPGNGKLLAQLRAWGEVDDVEYTEDEVLVRVRIPRRHVGQVEAAGGRVSEVEPR